MSKLADDIIGRVERETGMLYDDPGNLAGVALLFGAVAREAGYSRHDRRDDAAAGVLIAHSLTPAGRAKREADEMLAGMLLGGMDPRDAGDLFGKRR